MTTSATCASSSTSPSPGRSWPGAPTGRDDRSVDEALRFLERLLAAAEAGQRTGSAIEVLILQALAHQERQDMPAALASLEQALTMAEPEGYVRIFLDEGPPMAALLSTAAQQGVARDHIRRLVTGSQRDPAERSRATRPGRAAERS